MKQIVNEGGVLRLKDDAGGDMGPVAFIKESDTEIGFVKAAIVNFYDAKLPPEGCKVSPVS